MSCEFLFENFQIFHDWLFQRQVVATVPAFLRPKAATDVSAFGPHSSSASPVTLARYLIFAAQRPSNHQLVHRAAANRNIILQRSHDGALKTA